MIVKWSMRSNEFASLELKNLNLHNSTRQASYKVIRVSKWIRSDARGSENMSWTSVFMFGSQHIFTGYRLCRRAPGLLQDSYLRCFDAQMVPGGCQMVPGGCQMMPGGRQMLPGGCQMLLDVARCCRKVARGARTLIFIDFHRF